MDVPHVLADRYTIGRLLGRGGMAVVHLGEDTRLHREVAIKLLRLDLADDPTAQTRFRREAQSAAALNHPSIVAVFDTGEDTLGGVAGGTHTIPYIVMEYVQGVTLREMLRDRSRRESTATIALPPSGRGGSTGLRDADQGTPLEIGQAVAITAHVLAALSYSHAMGIVHRDIKPGNVMVTPKGAVKVMDFGIARALADTSATMTSAQTVVGTAQYLSPEQARAQQVDARSDLYSTGCMLYELLTGRPPFVGDSPVAVAYQHVREQPLPPSHYNPEISEELDRVVMHALVKDREGRYQTADAFSNDLLNALDGRPVDAPPTEAVNRVPVSPEPKAAAPVPVSAGDDLDHEEPKRSRAGAWIAMIVALIAVAALGWFLADRYFNQEPTMVSVPAVTGKDKVTAEQLIREAGLRYDEGDPQPSDDVPKDSVISQDPEAATQVAEDSVVTVVLSSGSANVQVPDLTNKTQQEARDALDAQDLQVGNVETVDSATVEKGRVVSSDPPAGTVLARQTEVNLNISSGQIAAPDVTGQTLSEARSTLTGLGFKVETDYVTTNSTPAGRVISQNPGPGSLDVGSTIVLQVARAPVIITPTETPTPTDTPSTPTETPTTPIPKLPTVTETEEPDQ